MGATKWKKGTPASVEFGRRLKSCRIAAGYVTAADFARELKMDDYAYRHYERGDHEPDLSTLAKMSTLLGKSLDFLIAGKVTPFDRPPPADGVALHH